MTGYTKEARPLAFGKINAANSDDTVKAITKRHPIVCKDGGHAIGSRPKDCFQCYRTWENAR